MAKIEAAVSVAITRIRVAPSASPFSASRTASLTPRCWTSAPAMAFGRTIASGAAAMTASRSASARPLSSALIRTKSRGPSGASAAAIRKSRAAARAAALAPAATESSRSTITASAPLVKASASLRGLSAGTKSSDRIAISVPVRSAARPPRTLLRNVNMVGRQIRMITLIHRRVRSFDVLREKLGVEQGRRETMISELSLDGG